MRPAKSPDNTYTFGNLVAVSPFDIPPSRDGLDSYVLVKNHFVFSARPLNGYPQGQIGFSEPQRSWAQIGMMDPLRVQLYDPMADGTGRSYLVSMDAEIGFASKTKTTDSEYDQDQLMKPFREYFPNQIFAPGQQLLMDIRSLPLKVTIKTVTVGDISMEKQGSSPTTSDPLARGILVKDTVINFFNDPKSATKMKLKGSARTPRVNAIVQPDFKFESMGIGGLDHEFQIIFRRAFASRIFPPATIEKLGIQHVKGVLLFGPPGTGKTLIARQIGKMLHAREPKVINGPEVLNKYVGASEENIRKMFGDAEKEYKEKGDDSELHIIIFDELDAVCKQRGSGGAGSTGVGDSVVNQLLSKLDGVDQLNNILLIGMTNRKDMIDDALLRPGRLEVHVEISLPDEAGRLKILDIHTSRQRKNGSLDDDVDLAELASLTKNFSGAELSGLVRAATSYAFARHTKVGTMAAVSDDVEDLKVNRSDLLNALQDVQAAFGVSEQSLERCLEGGLLDYSETPQKIVQCGQQFVREIQKDPRNSLLSALFHGPRGSGKTALAAQVALKSEYPFVRLISPEDMLGFNEMAKANFINNVFADAHKSSLSMVVIDNIESIIDWSDIGPRFSNFVLVNLATNIGKKPPKGRRLLVLGTSSKYEVMRQLDLADKFDHEVTVPNVANFEELGRILHLEDALSGDQERRAALNELYGWNKEQNRVGVGIKRVLGAVRQASQQADQVGEFVEGMRNEMLRVIEK